MHTFVFEHPEFVFDEVVLGPEQILGEIGGGYELTRDWFVEERLMIAARATGAAERALTLASDWANERVQSGGVIASHQLIGAMIADSTCDIALCRALTHQVAWEADNGMPRKLRARQGGDGQADRVGGGRAGDRPRRADLRRARLHAREPGRAALPRHPGGPDLGGHLGDPADDHRRRGRASAASTGCSSTAPACPRRRPSMPEVVTLEPPRARVRRSGSSGRRSSTRSPSRSSASCATRSKRPEVRDAPCVDLHRRREGVLGRGRPERDARLRAPTRSSPPTAATGDFAERVADLVPQPTLSAITGYCIGGGLELALATDFRIAEEDSDFRFPEVALGILPSWGGTQRAVRLLGPARAKELILLRERVDAQAALSLGLVTEVVARRRSALPRALELAERLSGLPRLAVSVTKQVIDALPETSRTAGLGLERVAYGLLAQSERRHARP